MITATLSDSDPEISDNELNLEQHGLEKEMKILLDQIQVFDACHKNLIQLVTTIKSHIATRAATRNIMVVHWLALGGILTSYGKC